MSFGVDSDHHLSSVWGAPLAITATAVIQHRPTKPSWISLRIPVIFYRIIYIRARRKYSVLSRKQHLDSHFYSEFCEMRDDM